MQVKNEKRSISGTLEKELHEMARNENCSDK